MATSLTRLIEGQSSKPAVESGLRAGPVDKTSICTVAKEGIGLTYGGYNIQELAEKSSFEEVAYLLLRGKLPTCQELVEYRARLRTPGAADAAA
jgi:2-methylcitrate synthase